MLFNSFEFLIFLPIVFLLYWFLCKSKLQQNLLIVVASYVFYGWWDWRFLLLIAFTSLCSYESGIAILRYTGNRKIQKLISTTNIVVNLLILGIFKYYNFFADSLAELFSSFGYQVDAVTLNIILPVGISFYTFQALSYSIDVYQGKIKPNKDVIQFFAFISFFPQLVAGPIERATHLLPQFSYKRHFDYGQAVDGLRQMLWGFFKKVAVADLCAYYVNQNWNYYEELPGLMLIQLALLFTFQIYGDFSGYSDIAIGCGKLFGIRLKKNFDVPYFSRNIAEFWRRWHISLMTWFRDYVYIPLGGNRCNKKRAAFNTIIVFLISGLWHGSNWTFVIWGGYNGLLLVVAAQLGWNRKYQNIVAFNRRLPNLQETASMILTFVLVVFGWVIFRSSNLSECMGFIQSIANNRFAGEGLKILYAPILTIFFMLIIEWISRNKQYLFELPIKGVLQNRVVRWIIYYAMVLAVFRMWGFSQDFIYFQF